MNSLVIYYSLQGNTRYIAERIAETTGSAVQELQPIKDISRKGFFKYIVGGKQAIKKASPPLQPLSRNPQEFDILFLGTPVWGWTYTPSFNTLFKEHPFFGKKIALFCCHGGGMGQTFSKMEAALPQGNQIVDLMDFQNPLRDGENSAATKAEEWAEAIMKKVSSN